MIERPSNREKLFSLTPNINKNNYNHINSEGAGNATIDLANISVKKFMLWNDENELLSPDDKPFPTSGVDSDGEPNDPKANDFIHNTERNKDYVPSLE